METFDSSIYYLALCILSASIFMKILLVEDDQGLAQAVKESLAAQRCTVDLATDGGEGSFLGKNYEYDAILLDYSLPKKDGLAVCKDIRASGRSTPIIFLSVIDDLETKISALNHGADDYMVKPFALEELHARLRAIGRRPAIRNEQAILTAGVLTMNLDTHQVFCKGTEIRLTKKEFGVLEYLMRHKGTVVSRVLIMEHVWTTDNELLSNAVESHIRNIRKKIGKLVKAECIKNIAGRGYMMTP